MYLLTLLCSLSALHKSFLLWVLLLSIEISLSLSLSLMHVQRWSERVYRLVCN